MTTIACNKEMMACDLQATGGYKFKLKTKIIVVEDNQFTEMFNVKKLILGAAGTLSELADIWTWAYMPEGKMPRTRNLQYLMLTGDGRIMYSENFISWAQMDQKFAAVGSGSPFAMAALESGKDPLEACKVAAKLDPGTGMGYKKFML